MGRYPTRDGNNVPTLTRMTVGAVSAWTDPVLRRDGILVAFSERTGGASRAPFDSLNLGAHVGDDPRAVTANRRRLLEALGIGDALPALTMAEQVHGERIELVTSENAGAGSRAGEVPVPIPAADALLTVAQNTPLLLCFADCVPVILVAPTPAVSVVHAGWRGALASLPGASVARLAEEAGCRAADVRAYVGPHIGPCHYEVSDEIMSHFVNRFGTFARAESGGLDLGAVVVRSLTDSGVDPCNIVCLGACTAEATDRFFSYRAEGGLTGRHGALACILSPSSRC